MFVFVHEEDGIADIFFVANLMIFSILVEGCLIFADDGFFFVVILLVVAADEWKF